MTQIKHIHQIEITSRCNRKCEWCIHKDMTRPKVDMTEENFKKSLSIVRHLYDKGGQTELWLHGLGESLLHPKFLEFSQMARETLPYTLIRISTNGILMTDEIARRMRELKVSCHISMYAAKEVVIGAAMAHKHGILEYLGNNPVQAPTDWAGQCDWPVPLKLKTQSCQWLNEGWAMIWSTGEIVSCCVDGFGKGIIGHIDNIEWPKEIDDLEIKPYELCKKCNMQIPDKFTHELARF